MRTWLLQSRRGGRTCGHLHIRESGAWRCRDLQAEPAAWSVVSTWLADPEGARPKRDWNWDRRMRGGVSLDRRDWSGPPWPAWHGPGWSAARGLRRLPLSWRRASARCRRLQRGR